MASAASVLAVIRSARPHFRSVHDRVAFAVHSAFLASGYTLTAVGSCAVGATPPSASGSAAEENEVGVDGWNELDDGSYSFQYSSGGEAGLSKSVIVKCTAMGDLLMVDAAPLSDADTPYSLEIKVDDYAVDTATTNFSQQYTKLDSLVEQLKSSIISKLSPSSAGGSAESSKSPTSQNEREQEREVRIPSRSSILEDPPRGSGFGFPEVPVYGGSDLTPGFGAGVFVPRRDPGVGVGVGGSMFVGPNDPRWGRMAGGNGQPPLGGPTPPEYLPVLGLIHSALQAFQVLSRIALLCLDDLQEELILIWSTSLRFSFVVEDALLVEKVFFGSSRGHCTVILDIRGRGEVTPGVDGFSCENHTSIGLKWSGGWILSLCRKL